MPKRAPTPPPADDTRFFTVVNPYPEQPYLALEDSKIFARWIACIIGQEHLLAFYHKPKSPNVVIIETSKFGPDFNRLTGEHRWQEFLQKPCASERHEASRIFPCTLTTTRAMEKTGWICRDIPMSWFKRWSPDNDSCVVYPYPQSRYCSPPSEDVTRYPLCRPIPRNRAEEKSDMARKPLLTLASRGATSSCASSDADPSTPSTSDFSDYPLTPPPERAETIRRFVPAIHGCDTPRASCIVVDLSAVRSPQSIAAVDDDADDDESAQAAKNLCKTHGALCVSGICKECAARKREAKFAERTRQREAERSHRGRGRGWGPKQSRQHEHDARKDGPGRSTEMPPHLQSQNAVAKGADPRSRLREEIRVEMANRKRIAKSVASTATRAMPAHLLKGSNSSQVPRIIKPVISASSSTTSISSASVSTRTSSDDSLSESSITPPSSVLDVSEDAHSLCSSPTDDTKSNSLFGPEPELQARQECQRGPWGPSVDWRAYARIPEGDARSVATGATDDAFGNPWKHVPSMRPAPLKWADDVEEAFSDASGGVRAAWDDDESSEDEEPF
ncbi:hypothetical protein BV20DRAFT_59720 [Pilatotrama ljubarskyi]|nr:hypothetical protein BV20DRAFT_59720 [Pilatotrama ljubarskyi]